MTSHWARSEKSPRSLSLRRLSEISDAMDLRPRELTVVSLLALLILIAGIYPQAVLDLIRVAGEAVIARIPEPD